jgi:hypothetical protein
MLTLVAGVPPASGQPTRLPLPGFIVWIALWFVGANLLHAAEVIPPKPPAI